MRELFFNFSANIKKGLFVGMSKTYKKKMRREIHKSCLNPAQPGEIRTKKQAYPVPAFTSIKTECGI